MGLLIRPLAVLIAALVLQLELFSDVRFFGVMPELMLGATIAAAWAAGPERGAIVGFGAGLLYDLFLPTPLALTAMSYALVGHFVGMAGAAVADTSERMLRRLISLAGTAAGIMVFVTLGELLGQPNMYNDRLVRVLVVSSLYTAVLMPLLHRAMAWAFDAHDQAANAPLRVRVVE